MEGMSIFFSIAESREARSVRHLKIPKPANASGLVAEVYREVRAEYLLAAPLLLHSPVPDLLHGFWSVFRETLLSKGDSEDTMEVFVEFRGAEPSIQPLLERRGLQ